MTANDHFQQAYAKLRKELIIAMESTTKTLLTNNESSAENDNDFPLEFAKKIALIYESEQVKKIAEGNSLAVEFTDGKLRSLLETLKKQYHALIEESKFQLNPDDPLFCTVDAFSLIEWGLKEVPHTKMLAFFLDPKREHGLDNLPMGFLLAAASVSEVEIGVENYQEISVGKIEAERWIKVNGKKLRLDIYIEMEIPKCRILIEGKIEGKQGEDQLSDYKSGFKPEENDVLIYLTPNGETPEEPWCHLDWKDVALAFCALANYGEFEPIKKGKHCHDGYELLRLWTSTLLHHVCGVPVVSKKPEDDTLQNAVAHASHIIKVKEILEEYKGGQYAGQQIA
ncbi:MAG: PD-(D/E)XK nuclease family protein [Proteobacteria bacterium]|nr:hypothetical protein [Desulfobacteraceae bacterium]MBU4012952.1 PD-(D/E)XK nuclease family protein [Pseudomonadota bacterium]MBU4066974.1 PD-(D/E)XK nuclease family protein [Pseudomonadota bacterium]MBU4100436.1 PD-(D/E)XK nuclease family protein [Pseudomonadota bacterium]MBU4127316.1 PD-(D/E)XK nuclease family protein [Pseudomonadota bacterium]